MRYVTITVSTKVAGQEIEWQAEAPCLDELSELDTIAGAPDRALEWTNGHLSTDAGNAGRPLVRNVTIPAGVVPGSPEFGELVKSAIVKAQAASKGYSPQGAKAPVVRAKAAAMDDLLARIKRGERPDQAYLDSLATQFGI